MREQQRHLDCLTEVGVYGADGALTHLLKQVHIGTASLQASASSEDLIDKVGWLVASGVVAILTARYKGYLLLFSYSCPVPASRGGAGWEATDALLQLAYLSIWQPVDIL